MQQEVYVDLYFLINTGMNLLCLMITASLLHRRVHRLRALVAAAVGGAYAVAALLFGASGTLGFLMDCALGFVMCAIAFASRRGHFSHLLKCTAVEVLTSMILGGVMTALYSLLNRLDLPFESLSGDGLSVWVFLLLSLVAGIATVRGGRFFGLSKTTKSVRLYARLFEREITLSALIDSGNLLRDPMSGRGVIVADRKRLAEVLPPALYASLCKSAPDEWLANRTYARFIRIIPTKTATGESLLPAIVPQELELEDGKGRYPANYLIAMGELGESAAGFDAVIPAQ
ncbi:MAG: sigma-E processing peptidase SpoIIGA [Clostridia bacterium]|nr:sigma-E processing peptidase SpoIIGA [Clostridia bacterium]